MTAVCAFAQVTNPIITNTTTTTSSLPPVGIGSTETVQVILANTNSSAGASPCSGSVSFYDVSGALIGSATSYNLTAGETTQVSLPYAAAGSASPRALVRAMVSLTTFSPDTACSLSYSLAVFDTITGATHAVIVNVARISGGSATPVARHL